MPTVPHLVWSEWMADSYRRGGWDVTEVRPGVWRIVNPRVAAREAGESHGKATKGKRGAGAI